MREIKFRAWDTVINQMIYNVFPRNSHGDVVSFDYDVNPHGTLIFVKLMQFTGLHDKNGKEIYEGDILATSNDGKDGCDIWDIKTFGYTKVIWDIASSRFRGTKWTWGVGEIDSVYDLNYVEVIGNIYENPELLKEVK
jgi:uncharacterized phage protein (TIGR01671 family)